MMSAAGTAWSRMNSGMPGRTKMPRPTSPITGSQQYKRRRIEGTHPRDSGEDCRADIGGPHIARQHAVASLQNAAIGDSVDEFLDGGTVDHAALPGAVAGMVRELDRMDRPDLHPEALHRKNRRGIAHMAVGDVGLYREDVHRLCPKAVRG